MTSFFPWHKVKFRLANLYSALGVSAAVPFAKSNTIQGFKVAGNILTPFAISGHCCARRKALKSFC